jgi:hypothetical protein
VTEGAAAPGQSTLRSLEATAADGAIDAMAAPLAPPLPLAAIYSSDQNVVQRRHSSFHADLHFVVVGWPAVIAGHATSNII